MLRARSNSRAISISLAAVPVSDIVTTLLRANNQLEIMHEVSPFWYPDFLLFKDETTYPLVDCAEIATKL